MTEKGKVIVSDLPATCTELYSSREFQRHQPLPIAPLENWATSGAAEKTGSS